MCSGSLTFSPKAQGLERLGGSPGEWWIVLLYAMWEEKHLVIMK